ncbi:hypothetical protein K504DRAFT_503077 [Pleomassaria siparia CBS 279.74]|uniref:Uncharacterized protein n=1 Tax=Pleomassaria siparia CBS 279.74 TaxID=1314801 RepID=A0A6G1K861_9PLEO|nr:hypothetical protein K504DRAFT_503077 [Pleomassaria siparia CBS 279.74]
MSIVTAPVTTSAPGVELSTTAPITQASCKIATPLSYNRLLARFQQAQRDVAETIADARDAVRAVEIHKILEAAIHDCDAGLKGGDISSPGKLKREVAERISDINDKYDAKQKGCDYSAGISEETPTVAMVNDKATSTIEDVTVIKNTEMNDVAGFKVPNPIAKSAVKIQILKVDSRGHGRYVGDDSPSMRHAKRKTPGINATKVSKRPRVAISIPRINPECSAKELFYLGMQFAQQYSTAAPERLQAHVRDKLSLELDPNTGEILQELFTESGEEAYKKGTREWFEVNGGYFGDELASGE